MPHLSLTCLNLCVGRSNADPFLDEDTESDTPIPNRMFTEGDDTRTVRQITGSASIVDWAVRNVGDTHIGKRKHRAFARKKKAKKAKLTDEVLLGSDEPIPSPDERHSLSYQESNLSTSASSDDDDGDDGGSGGYGIVPSQPLQFTCMKYLQFFIHL
jgi:hypothetical protein